MKGDQYRVVYDIANESIFGMNEFILLWLIGVLFMSALVMTEAWMNKFSLSHYTVRNKLALVVLPLFLIVGICANVEAIQTQRACLDARANGDYEILQGVISGFKREGKLLSFDVGKVTVLHRNSDGTKCGYKPDRGGNLRDGLPVILYRYNGQTLRLEAVN